MVHTYTIPIWKKAPFIRLLLPLVVGILLQWYIKYSLVVIIAALLAFNISFFLFLLLPIALRYKLKTLQGSIIQLIFISLGCFLTWQNDIRRVASWYGNLYHDGNFMVVRIKEPLIEKTKSYKADALVELIIEDGKIIPCKGKLLLYFSKDSLNISSRTIELSYGARVIIYKNLQPIKNSGNPGAFNYEQYAAFQGIFHHVFLKKKDWDIITPNANRTSGFNQFIFSTRAYILTELRSFIRYSKDELAIAEALLIGYTNDLDKDLVQAYSNTGVVHIIAISGMHLGLIYILLLWIFAKIPLINKSKIIQLILLLSCLWLFSILTGAAPSVLRAAVMFSFIAIGKQFFKQASIYNSLAASAFLLLCYNPYYLWAVGFQLSYLAVLGIVVFQKTIYNLVYIKNKLVDKIWQLITVSLAAQLLTFSICIYYFHQFPNLFLISNIIAVPLSAIILYVAIALVSFSWIPHIGMYLGKIVGGLTWLMNKFILLVNVIPFSVWNKITATILSTCLLYIVVIFFTIWIIHKNKNYFYVGLVTSFMFTILIAYYSWQTFNQQQLIVYNIPQHQAIDFVNGNRYQFVGDSMLLEENLLTKLHLNPARISLQLNSRENSIINLFHSNLFYHFNNKRILIIDKPIVLKISGPKIDIDLLIISKNPTLNILELTKKINLTKIVFDSSNADWKIKKWIEECRLLNLNYHSVPDSGTFIYYSGT